MHHYSVSGLVEEVDSLLKSRYPAVLVEAELQELTVSPAGHAFMTLSDNKASMRAVAWRSTWQSMRYRPKAGEQVLVRGRLAVYTQRGAFQLYVNDVRPAGLGALAKEIEARKARLAAEGLLDPRRKRALPTAPAFVGVATSLRGAALQDFLRVSGERFPHTRILVAGCTVQGPRAPAEILRAVELLIEDGRAEVIVVTRGGGSQEDLMAFQDEQLARFLADCPVPVVSAVGHEVDTTIADLVADVSVSTPTAAAVRVLPDGPALLRRTEDLEVRLEETLVRHLQQRREQVEGLILRLERRHPTARLSEVRSRAVEAERALDRLIARRVRQARLQLDGPVARLPVVATWVLQQRQQQVRSLEDRLRALSPDLVLERGYAVVTGPSGVLHDASQVAAGDAIQVRLARGAFAARVESSS